MVSFRRFITYAGLALVTLLIFGHFHEGIVSQARIRYDAIFPSATRQHADGKFHWSDVPVHYPVKSLAKLPTARPQKLPKVQFDFPPESPDHATTRKERQTAVKNAFERCWKAYKQLAWMKDEVTPLNGNFKNGFGGWAASLVDSLDTLWIMGYKDEFEEAVKAAMDIDLGVASTEMINVFETGIRHLGGLLSAYDLSGDKRLLDKAKEFGEMLLKAFDTPNRMPITRWKPQEALAGPQEADDVILLAEIGSLTMEFTRLSQLTGDMRWYDAVDRIMRIFVKQQDETHIPGMFPVVVNAKDADFTRDSHFTLGAMADSFYEYLPKMHALLGGVEPIYSKLYEGSMKPAIKYNLWKPMTPDNADILLSGNVKADMGKPPSLEAQGQHLVCFAGGMFALGGKLFAEKEHVGIGQKLTDGCIWTYRALPMGMMPEVSNALSNDQAQILMCRFRSSKWSRALRAQASANGTRRNGRML